MGGACFSIDPVKGMIKRSKVQFHWSKVVGNVYYVSTQLVHFHVGVLVINRAHLILISDAKNGEPR